MYWIKRRLGGTWDRYPIYTTHEADAEGIDYAYWPYVDVGEWGKTDDGYVLQCHRIYEMDRAKGVALQLVFSSGRPIVVLNEATDTIRKSRDFNFLAYLRTGGHQYSKPQTWQEREANKNRTQRACQAWAQFWIMRQGQLTDHDWRVIGTVYRADDANDKPAATAKRLFNEPEIQREAMQKLAEMVLESGETPADVVDKYNRLFDEALASEEDKDLALDVARDLRDMLGMSPDRQPAPNEDSHGDTTDWLHTIEEEQQQLDAESAVKELPAGGDGYE